ncbi:hypothetical protein DWB85_15675 [Seongchinamella sediminis]|uniref:Thioredoxin domain-containing protein n=1 Tax=Seongchinamella sediminis TaxID=2283635 RepID=A0A3L7DTX2_9GAMM|nr:thioredoxin family protein [Seongchinamella sediminis]RLQ20834.1 hypothetical protein DWB85_15675 [Seongchinamella sediminis]
MQKFLLLTSALLLHALTPASANEINKCEINGRIVYTDKACPNGSGRELELKAINAMPSATPRPSVKSSGAQTAKAAYQSDRWYVDHAGYSQALGISRRRSAPIFIYAYADWCKFCRKFEDALLPSREARETLSSYVKVRLNPEHSDRDLALFEEWGGTGYPALFVQHASDSVPRKHGSPFVRGRLLSPEEFSQRFQYGITAEAIPID